MLAGKGITVLVVDLSATDAAQLTQWATERQIPYPAGGLTGDVEQSKIRWGVKSLPWLVLTDADHIVQAEGFGLSELDDKLDGS
jgi:hypothetical protein